MNKSIPALALACALASPALAAPTVAITGMPANPSNSSSATFSFTGTSVAAYTCTLKSSTGSYASVGPCTSPKSYANLPNDNYYFQLDGTDTAGAVASTYYSFVLNAPLPPAVTLTATPPATVTVPTATYQFTGSNVSSFVCTLTRQSSTQVLTGACTSPKAYSGLVNDNYTFKLEGVAANGTRVSKTHSFAVNVPNPALPSLANFKATPSAIIAGQQTTLSWTASNATSLSLSNVGNVTGKTSVTVQPGTTTVYQLTASNAAGSVTASTSVAVTVAPSTVGALSNPVTAAITGTHATYQVGPGKAYPTPDQVPWSSLTAGDVVNIHYSPTPYKYKLCVTGVGTQAAPIIVNGVTDAAGNRPKLEFNGAKTAAGCGTGNFPAFVSTDQWDSESLGGITIKRGNGEFPPTPAWIQIKNLEVYGAANGNSYTTFFGQTRSYSSSAGIYVHVGTDILLENNVVYNNGFGIFTMAKNDTLDYAVQRLTARNNRVFLNGKPNSYYEHNFYVQSTNPLIEGNYIGQTMAGSQGSSYKSRASAEVFRYNYVEASVRALDLVHSEEQTNGIMAQPDYGTDYVYGNIIVSDHTVTRDGGGPALHYGGDNMGEDDRLGTPPLVLPANIKYRSKLHFFNNTVYLNSKYYQTSVLDLSLSATTVEAWNNIIVAKGTYPSTPAAPTYITWLEFAGTLNLRGNNLVTGVVANSRDDADPTRMRVNKLGTLIAADPKFVDPSIWNFNLQAGSPAIDKATLPSGLAANLATMKATGQPQHKTNGIVVRPVTGAATDLGALEAK